MFCLICCIGLKIKYVDQHKFSIMHSCYSWHRCIYQSEQALKTIAHQCKYGITRHSVLDLLYIFWCPQILYQIGGVVLAQRWYQLLYLQEGDHSPGNHISICHHHLTCMQHTSPSIRLAPSTVLTLWNQKLISVVLKNQFLHHRCKQVVWGSNTVYCKLYKIITLCAEQSFWTLGR